MESRVFQRRTQRVRRGRNQRNGRTATFRRHVLEELLRGKDHFVCLAYQASSLSRVQTAENLAASCCEKRRQQPGRTFRLSRIGFERAESRNRFTEDLRPGFDCGQSNAQARKGTRTRRNGEEVNLVEIQF